MLNTQVYLFRQLRLKNQIIFTRYSAKIEMLLLSNFKPSEVGSKFTAVT